MRIGMDCQSLGVGARHGFSTYLDNLLRVFRARHPEHDIRMWTCTDRAGWRIPHQLWWDQVQVPWLGYRDQVDLIHTPAFSGPVVSRVPVVMTVMDMLYTRYPEWLPNRRAQWYWGRWIPFASRHASAVIAPSDATKRDLVVLGGVPPDRITVIPLAVDPVFMSQPATSDIEAYRVRKGLTMPYILYVGILDRRKDLGGLLRAYAAVCQKLKKVRLVIAGHVIRGRSNLPEEIDAAGLGEQVLLPGYVPDRELPLLYAGASLFVYPSWWEGFGLPPLEAMAMGVPVITYRTSSLPEVVGDAAILIDPPFDPADLEVAVRSVFEDEGRRDAMIAKGKQRITAFSWEAAADRTMDVYRQCMAHGG